MNKYNLKLTSYLEKQYINCDDFKDLYSELREQQIPLSLAGRLEHHFEECNECQSLAEDIELIIEEAKHCFQITAMPAGVRDRLHKRLNEELGLNFARAEA